jgi:CubicO group peptidase (beta-lactamase class C family)
MKKSCVIFAAIIAGVLFFPLTVRAADPLPRAKPEEVGMSSERLALIGKVINAEIANGQTPGGVVAVARRGKLVYFEAFGYRDKAAGAPMTTDTIFSVASMTKPMVAVGALQLYERGRLLIDDPLAKYFPKFADMQVAVLDTKKESIVERVPAARKITIQDLFRHTSGLSYGASGTTPVHKMYPPSSNIASRTFTSSEFLDLLSTLPLPFQPGAVWEYSLGLDVLGLVIESIAQQSLGQHLQTNVWNPLGMTDTGFVVPVEKAARYARALPNDPVTGRPQSVPSPMEKTKFECGGACAVSTAGDYLRFAQMLVNKGQFGDTRILGRKTVEYMLSNHLGPDVRNQIGMTTTIMPDYGFGLGLAVRVNSGIAPATGSVGDFSWPGAFGTYWWGDPREELAAVWMTSTPGAARGNYMKMVRALVNQAITD